MEKIKLNCTRCGNLFIYERKSSKGKLPAYCEDCKKEMILESKRKYVESKRQCKNTRDAVKTEKTILNTKTIIDTNRYKANNDYMMYTNRTLDLLGQLDTLRVNMCNLATELSDYQSNYDKQDQEFLHKIELNDFTNGAEALQFVNDWHKDRASRRNVKNLIKLLRDVISAVPMKTKFTAINNIQNYKQKEK